MKTKPKKVVHAKKKVVRVSINEKKMPDEEPTTPPPPTAAELYGRKVAAATAEMKAMLYQPAITEICVVDCCGVFGYLIPWALWKAQATPIVPTRDFSRPFVYLYSLKGQLDNASAKMSVIPTGAAYEIASVCLDDFIGNEYIPSIWHSVFNRIRAQYTDGLRLRVHGVGANAPTA